MAIWFTEFPLSFAQERSRGTMIEHLGIEILQAGEDYLRARMPVNAHTRQPAGMLHGGASVALAETLASWAATFCVDSSKQHCVGIEINANHLRPMADGHVYGTAGQPGQDAAGLGSPDQQRAGEAGLHLPGDDGCAQRREPVLTGGAPQDIS